MRKRDLVLELRSRYSFEIAYSLAQIAEEDGKFENDVVKITATKILACEPKSFNLEWKN